MYVACAFGKRKGRLRNMETQEGDDKGHDINKINDPAFLSIPLSAISIKNIFFKLIEVRSL